MKLQGKTALVTGAKRGIGLKLQKHQPKEGTKVFATGMLSRSNFVSPYVITIYEFGTEEQKKKFIPINKPLLFLMSRLKNGF